MILRKMFRFEASHVLPKHPGKCSRLHGHSWVLRVEVQGNINPSTGFVVDYAEISEFLKPLVESLDHHHLGTWDVVGIGRGWPVDGLPFDFYPSSENLLYWIADRLSREHFGWSALELEETCTSFARLERSEYDKVKGG